MPRQIIQVPKTQLAIHDAVRQTPEDRGLIELLFNEFTARIAEGVPPDEVIHDPFQITSANEIGDGRHRFLAALRVPQIKAIDCLVNDNLDLETLVVEKLTQRRHYSKSAKAYALRHTAIRIASANKAANKQHLRKGDESPVSRLNRLTGSHGSETIDQLAEKTNIGRDVLLQAIKLERDYMSRADKLIADWLELNPEDAELWQTWQDDHPSIEMPWSAWRADRLAKLKVADDAQSVNVIPKNWRELEEDKIFNGIVEPDGEQDDRRSYSLGSSLKALGSIFATAGKQRPDVNPNNPALYLTLQSKVASFSTTMWKNWGEVDAAGRLEVIKKLNESVITWPEDVRRALAAKLTAKPSAPTATAA